MSKGRVLIVEDDGALADVLTYNLVQQGYEVHASRDGRDALRQVESTSPELVVLDVMLPLIDGFEVCRALRGNSATRDVLILMLTAKSEETDQIVGLSLGADDYVTKPFSVKVLLERINALIRRRRALEGQADVLTCHGITLDRTRHRVAADSAMVPLTRSEFRLLEVLMRRPGRAFGRPELIDGALGDDRMVTERTIDVHIRSLRQKLGPYGRFIETVRGIGYRFREPELA